MDYTHFRVVHRSDELLMEQVAVGMGWDNRDDLEHELTRNKVGEDVYFILVVDDNEVSKDLPPNDQCIMADDEIIVMFTTSDGLGEIAGNRWYPCAVHAVMDIDGGVWIDEDAIESIG